jgi:hypothetical protein
MQSIVVSYPCSEDMSCGANCMHQALCPEVPVLALFCSLPNALLFTIPLSGDLVYDVNSTILCMHKVFGLFLEKS